MLIDWETAEQARKLLARRWYLYSKRLNQTALAQRLKRSARAIPKWMERFQDEPLGRALIIVYTDLATLPTRAKGVVRAILPLQLLAGLRAIPSYLKTWRQTLSILRQVLYRFWTTFRSGGYRDRRFYSSILARLLLFIWAIFKKATSVVQWFFVPDLMILVTLRHVMALFVIWWAFVAWRVGGVHSVAGIRVGFERFY